jgi:hypothetical protein
MPVENAGIEIEFWEVARRISGGTRIRVAG